MPWSGRRTGNCRGQGGGQVIAVVRDEDKYRPWSGRKTGLVLAVVREENRLVPTVVSHGGGQVTI